MTQLFLRKMMMLGDVVACSGRMIFVAGEVRALMEGAKSIEVHVYTCEIHHRARD